MARSKMSEKDKRDWESLYNYVKNLLNYDENQALSRNMVLRLKGLLNNKFMANKSIQDTANYSYEIVLNTFKFCAQDIQNGFRTKSFKDENHKFNYALKIVENNINNVYLRMKRVETAKEEVKNIPTEIIEYDGAKYKPKEKKQNKFSDLW